jgi:hypothetical protein
MSISNTVLTTATANVLYGTSVNNYAVTTLYIHNSSASTAYANIMLVQSGGAAGNAKIYGNKSIAAGDTLIMDAEKLILAQGDGIHANCYPTSVGIMTISYVGI